jgi:transcriptional regulator with XRE-family HTH domain
MTKIQEANTQIHNSPLVSRLRSQMIRKGLNPKTLAERAKVGRSFVYDILSGRSCNPTSGKIASIADELGVSMQYLLNGVHSTSSSLQKGWADIAKISKIQVENTIDSNIVVSTDDHNPAYYFTEAWIRETIESTPENVRSLRISCDSMQPCLKADDYILIDTTKRNVNPPGVFVIFDGVSLKARRLEMLSPTKILVRADNKSYGQYEAAPQDINIIGKMIWLGRSF